MSDISSYAAAGTRLGTIPHVMPRTSFRLRTLRTGEPALPLVAFLSQCDGGRKPRGHDAHRQVRYYGDMVTRSDPAPRLPHAPTPRVLTNRSRRVGAPSRPLYRLPGMRLAIGALPLP